MEEPNKSFKKNRQQLNVSQNITVGLQCEY